MTLRCQDLRLARHSVPSNLDLAISLLAKVRDAEDLDSPARDEAARLLAALEPVHASEGLSDERRHEVLAPVARDLERLDDAVNGPLPGTAT